MFYTNKKDERIGEKIINKQGLEMWICDYRNANDLDVVFDDGFVSKNKTYSNFKRKNITNPNFDRANFLNRTGEENYNYQGCLMKIIEYYHSKNITIEFQDEYKYKKYNAEYIDFKRGQIINPYFPEVYGIGYIGKGKYTSSGKYARIYDCWRGIFKRIYIDIDKQPTYKDCSICKEWLCYQSFAKWFESNMWDDNIKFQVDKDIIFKGNKIYSPETCTLVDNNINCLFTKTDKLRGDYPIGVYYRRCNGKFRAQCSCGIGHQQYLGEYDTPEEAFKAYKEFKENYIKQVADEYKQKYPQFPQRLYEAMMNYEVEITD